MEEIRSNITLGNRYVIGQRIGKGSYTEVFEAKDRTLKRTVAVKILKKELKGDSSILDRFRSMAHVTAGITHPNVISVYDIDDGEPYMVMPLIGAGDLVACRRSRQQQNKPFLAVEIAYFLYAVSHALLSAHRKGFIHANLSPRNILLADGSIPLITDFALDRTKGGIFHKSLAASDTFPYLSTEQWDGKAVKPHTDQYALALVAYYLLTGKHPPRSTRKEGGSMKNLFDKELFLECSPHIARKLVDILQRCLEEEGSKRFTSMLSIVSEIDGIREKAFKFQERKSKKVPRLGKESADDQEARKILVAPPEPVIKPAPDSTPEKAPTPEKRPPPRPEPPFVAEEKPSPPPEVVLSAEQTEELLNKAKQLIRDRRYEEATAVLNELKNQGARNYTAQRLEREVSKRLLYQKKIEAFIQDSFTELKAGRLEKAEQKLFSALQLDRNNKRVKQLLEKVMEIRSKKAAVQKDAGPKTVPDKTIIMSADEVAGMMPPGDSTQAFAIPLIAEPSEKKQKKSPKKSIIVSVEIAPPLIKH